MARPSVSYDRTSFFIRTSRREGKAAPVMRGGPPRRSGRLRLLLALRQAEQIVHAGVPAEAAVQVEGAFDIVLERIVGVERRYLRNACGPQEAGEHAIVAIVGALAAEPRRVLEQLAERLERRRNGRQPFLAPGLDVLELAATEEPVLAAPAHIVPVLGARQVMVIEDVAAEPRAHRGAPGPGVDELDQLLVAGPVEQHRPVRIFRVEIFG